MREITQPKDRTTYQLLFSRSLSYLTLPFPPSVRLHLPLSLSPSLPLSSTVTVRGYTRSNRTYVPSLSLSVFPLPSPIRRERASASACDTSLALHAVMDAYGRVCTYMPKPHDIEQHPDALVLSTSCCSLARSFACGRDATTPM